MFAYLNKRLFSVLLIAALIVPTLAITPFAGAQEEVYYPTTEWRTSTPEEQGMDSAQLLAALDYVEENALRIDSITVIRHGYVVLDAYYYPYTADMQHHVWDATESFISALVGIAVDRGLIAGLDQPLLALFPDRTIANRTSAKEALTVGHLLSMASEIACGPYDTLMQSILEAPDPLGSLLDLEIQSAPGSPFSYCDLNSDLLAGAVETAAGRPLLDFANQYLFGPLGITDYQWQTYPNGLPFGQFGLHLTPHDLARLGYLYLHHGQWAGQQVVSSAWVDTATCADPAQCPFYNNITSQTRFAGRPVGYGYHWWLYAPSFYTSGLMIGQYIAVAPEYDMVVVLTSRSQTLEQKVGTILFGLIGDRVIGSVGADDPLPTNPDAVAALDARVAALANPQPQAVQPLPDKAAALNDVDYVVSPATQLYIAAPYVGSYLYGASLDVSGFKLTFDQSDQATLELEFSDGYRVALPVGLDGVPRVADSRIGPLAATGQWAPTGTGFAVELEWVGSGDQRTLSFGYLGKNLVFMCQDPSTENSQPPARPKPRE